MWRQTSPKPRNEAPFEALLAAIGPGVLLVEVEGVRRSCGLAPDILEAQGLCIVGACFVVGNGWDELRTMLGLDANVNV
eukprot:CAMPEP_0177349962 /NCGR_PEP_ID=MMETSP0368-20130122/31075_1 /TAXON_ID=447022 ORGANISM="Scrippsiella hangoei-like, Strain SHHI-4" /NCGR_SAMPLE_ID=MMETSP0368 /ASSEMBLY_ACC=CAM_ASM_000363 /LENGTH=78 /DNA_ID=CAMNT_0018811869 /DNA_START=113 /DNA_END=349 /DNA_ORIENTATION=-